MRGVETLIRRLFEGRSRKWSVITIIGLVVLALGLPAVDQYLALRRQEAELSVKLHDAENQVQQVGRLQQRADVLEQQLSVMTSRALSEDEAAAYRQTLVQHIRSCGCQLRKLNVDTPTYRNWLEDDDPLKTPQRRPASKTNSNPAEYELRSQTVSLSVSGNLEEARALLSQLHSMGKLMHVGQLAIRPAGNRKDVVMELQFTLFSLEKPAASKAAKPLAA